MRRRPPVAAPARWAAYYVRAWDFALVPVPEGAKGPRHPGWNRPGGYFTRAGEAYRHWLRHPRDNMGVVLVPSKLVSLDVDEPDWARAALHAVGLELDELLQNAVLVQGRPPRVRALYKEPPGENLERRRLAWPSPGGRPLVLFELRAGGVQDLLPPSRHPDTRREYRWLRAPWQLGEVPLLPAGLLELWRAWDDLKEELVATCPWPTRRARRRRVVPTSGGMGSWDEIRSRVKRRVSLEEMLEALGAERRGGSYLCPFHAERHPSFWTFRADDGSSRWVDGHGGAPVGFETARGYSVGDVIDIYQALRGLPSPGKATAELARSLGLLEERDGK